MKKFRALSGAIAAAVCLAAFVLLIVLLKTVDVGERLGEKIGLYTLNDAVFSAAGGKLNGFWYGLTEVLGYAAIAIALFFAGYGIFVAVRNKSLKAVGKDIYALAACYVLLIAAYAVFEAVIVNYRPVLLDGQARPEASFPSSHTMLTVGVFGTAIVEICLRIKNARLKTALSAVCAVLCVIATAGRLLSCAHWFTDVLGGALFALAVVFGHEFFVSKYAAKTVEPAKTDEL